jgi:hypothetical protein
MLAAVRLPGGLELRICDDVAPGAEGRPATGRPPSIGYPTGRLQKGLVLLDDGHDLSEEGVGIGVPVLKRGLQAVFPGAVTLAVRADGPTWRVTAAYRMDLVERLAGGRGGPVRSRSVYALRDVLAAAHRRVPALRAPLTALSNAARRRLAWATTFEKVPPVATIPVDYRVAEGGSVVAVAVDLRGVPAGAATEIALMTELGAGEFDRYEDAAGASLRGDAIGTWDSVDAATASFVSSRRGLAFTLAQAPGARLMRGREAVAGRLAWAGFGYVLRPGRPDFTYDVHISRLETRGTRP